MFDVIVPSATLSLFPKQPFPIALLVLFVIAAVVIAVFMIRRIKKSGKPSDSSRHNQPQDPQQ